MCIERYWFSMITTYLNIYICLIRDDVFTILVVPSLHLNAENGTMPLKLWPSPAPYVVFLLLYEVCVVCMFCKRVVWMFYFSSCIFRVVWNSLSLTFSFPVFWNWKQTGIAWCKHFYESGRSYNLTRRTWSLLVCPSVFQMRVY